MIKTLKNKSISAQPLTFKHQQHLITLSHSFLTSDMFLKNDMPKEHSEHVHPAFVENAKIQHYNAIQQ